MERCVPSIKRILFTDWSVFLTIFGYMFFIGLAFIFFFKAEYPFSNYDFLEWIEVISYFSLAAVITTPIGLWWCYVTRRTFKEGVVLKAKITEYFGAKGPYIGIYYTFNFNNKEYNHSATLLNKKVVKGLLDSEAISVAFDPKRKISFIYDIYCSDEMND